MEYKITVHSRSGFRRHAVLALVQAPFLLFLLANQGLAQVVLNEVMADNDTVVANDGEYPQWVELHNTTLSPVDLTDWSLTDAISTPRKFVFPAGTVIPGEGFLTVWLDTATTASGLHAGFSIKEESDDLTLFNSVASGSVQVDRVAFGLQPVDVSIGRVPDGSPNWVLTTPTFELANQAIALSAAVTNNLRINEIMANPSGGDDWFELYNTTTNYIGLAGLVFTDQAFGVTNRAIPALSFIEPGGFIQFLADDLNNNDADHVDFKLGNSGDRVLLYQANRTTLIDRIDFGAQLNGVSIGRLPDGGTNIVQFTNAPATPAASNFQLLTDIIINEALTHTDPPLEDAIELYNSTAATINIGGWWLSNSKDDPKKFRIPTGTTIAAGGYRVFYEWPGTIQGFNSNGFGTNRSFTLNSARGDQVYLHTADAAGNLTYFRASRSFGPAENGVSFGRYVTSDGRTEFVAMSRHTFGVSNPVSVTQFRSGTGLTNAYPKIGPLVINEIMYHPPNIVTETNSIDNTLDEYIELYNVTSGTVVLYDPAASTNTWRLRGVVDFNFPPNVQMGPATYLLLVNFDPALDPAQLAAFRSRYNVPSAVPIFGPYKGKLQNGSGSVELFKPDPPQTRPPDLGLVPYILVDRVKYSDDSPWPVAPDGTGAALERLRPEEYGNDPINWIGAVPTPGRQRIQIESIQRSGGTTTIRFNGIAHSSYTLQSQPMVFGGGGTGSNVWTTVTGVAAQPTSGTRQVTDTTTAPRRFYRILAP
jgi:hypothetical protein